MLDALATIPTAIIARMTRASVLDILGQEYITAARAKGLSERMVLGMHALRVARPPILTIAGLQLGYLLGGAVFTEEVFGWWLTILCVEANPSRHGVVTVTGGAA